MVVTSEILESASGFKDSSISGADDRRMIEGRLPVVVEVAEVMASDVKEVRSNMLSWLTLEVTDSALVADLDLTLLEAIEAASQAGHGRLVLLNREFVSELELRLSLVAVELPNFLLYRITLSTSTLSDSSRESVLN